MPEKSWEKELSLAKDDHWLVEAWNMGLDHIIEWVLHEVELDIDWAKEIRMACAKYLKLMIDFDMPSIEMDPKKIRPYFLKKMYEGATDVLTLDFMDFFTCAFA